MQTKQCFNIGACQISDDWQVIDVAAECTSPDQLLLQLQFVQQRCYGRTQAGNAQAIVLRGCRRRCASRQEKNKQQ